MTEYWRSWSRLPNPSRCNLLQLQLEPGQLVGFFYACGTPGWRLNGRASLRPGLARVSLVLVAVRQLVAWLP